MPLEIDPALVEFMILKARAFDVKVPPVEPDPGSNAADDGERGVLEDYPSDQTETELRDAIEGLSDEAAIDLVAIFWIGRGDFAPRRTGPGADLGSRAGRRAGRGLSSGRAQSRRFPGRRVGHARICAGRLRARSLKPQKSQKPSLD